MGITKSSTSLSPDEWSIQKKQGFHLKWGDLFRCAGCLQKPVSGSMFKNYHLRVGVRRGTPNIRSRITEGTKTKILKVKKLSKDICLGISSLKTFSLRRLALYPHIFLRSYYVRNQKWKCHTDIAFIFTILASVKIWIRVFFRVQ